MTFLNAMLLGGVAALGIPLVIHLLNRNRFRTVPWAAMHLLDCALETNSRRIRLEQLLLLLIRCAIPALLALCLARPVLTSWSAMRGDAPASVVVVLDDSYSMDAHHTSQSTLEAAVDETCKLLASLKRGSEVSVITLGGGPRSLLDEPLFDTSTVVGRLRQILGGQGPADLAGGLEAALALLSKATHADRELVLVSDFQRTDWDAVDRTAADNLRQQLGDLNPRPAVTFLRVGEPTSANVSVDSLTCNRTALGQGQQLQVRAHVRNRSAILYENLRLALSVDGIRQATSQVPLGAHASAQVLFTHQFQDPGSYRIEVQVEVEDGLQTDNSRALSITVLEQLDVLLVDGAQQAQLLESETGFLSVALTPYASGQAGLADLVRTETVQPRQLAQALKQPRQIVILANVPKLDDAAENALSMFVRQGGGLILFPGNRIDLDWYAERLSSEGLLPARFGRRYGGDRQSRQTTRVAPGRLDHPALQFFNDTSNGNLADAEIWTWHQLDLGQRAQTDGHSSVVARLESGDPFMVEAAYGQGVVLQAATACDADWSNLPMRPFYLPLIQELVVNTALRTTPARNLPAGQPLVAVLDLDSEDKRLTLRCPDGSRHTVRPVRQGNRCLARFSDTQRPGTYTVTAPNGSTMYFVSQVDRSESNTKLLEPKDLEDLAGSWGAEVVRSSGEYAKLDDSRRHGREIWQYVLAAVLCLLLAEVLLQQLFSMRGP